jgi:CBS domain-containing protein
MLEGHLRHLPVLDGGLIAGIVSIRDLLEVLVDDASQDAVVIVPSGTRVMLAGD